MTTTIWANFDSGTRIKSLEISRKSLDGVGIWETILDNVGNLYGGVLNAEDEIELKLNNVSMLKGYIDDSLPNVKSKTLPQDELLRVVGRDYGFDLAELFISKDYYNTKIDDMFDDALSVASSEITYSSGSTGQALNAKWKDDYLVNKFRELSKQANYDFYVDDSKALQLFAVGSATSSGVTLQSIAESTSNNILFLEEIGESVGSGIKRYVKVTSGNVDDHWTEGNASHWSLGGDAFFTLSNETTIILGNLDSISSIKATATDANILDLIFGFTVAKCGRTSIDLSMYGEELASVQAYISGVLAPYFRPRLMDGSGNVLEWTNSNPTKYSGKTEQFTADKWNKIEFPVGINLTIASSPTNEQWYYKAGTSFDWSDVVELSFYGYSYANAGCFYVIDSLRFPVEAYALSSTGGRNRMYVVNRSDLKSQVQLQAVADNELAMRQNPIEKIKLTTTFQSGCKYAGQTVVVKAPSSGIGSAETGVTYRILSLRHVAEPFVDLFKGYDAYTEFELVKAEATGVDPLRFRLINSPQQTQIERLESRLRSLEKSQ